ncbi:MAG: putative S-layer protein [Candidatus Pacearchaeota archaeon]|jgi:hypothetical protein
MKSKTLLLTLLTLILALSFVSAATFTVSNSIPSAFTKTTKEVSFSVTNRGPDTINLQVVIPNSISDGSRSLTLSSPSTLTYTNLVSGQSTGNIIVTYSGDTALFEIGTFSSNIVINAQNIENSTNSLSQNIPLTFLNTFCKYGENGTSLVINDVRISNTGDDDNEWVPLDEITIKAEIENTGDDKITGVEAEIGLYDSTGKNIISSMDDLTDRRISVGSLSSGKNEDVEFKFKVPTDFNDDSYNLVIKTFKNGKEAEICTSTSDLASNYYESITGARESDTEKHIVITNILLSPEATSNQCGEKIQLTGEIVNIGDTDYEDQVKVTLFNKELGINKEEIVREDFSEGDSSNVDFEFDIPKNAAEKTYVLELRTYYDYDSDDNNYNEISSQRFTKSIVVSGNCNKDSSNTNNGSPTTTTAKLQISADLDPETPDAIAGKQVIIKSNIKNTGTASATAVLSVTGNSLWSDLVSIEPQSLTLGPGESKDVSIVLDINKDADGENEFVIKTIYGTQTSEQKVVLPVTQETAQFGSISEHIKNNWFIYLIILVNLILIIAIISVVRKMIAPKRDFE